VIDARRRIALALLAGMAGGIGLAAFALLLISGGNPWLIGMIDGVWVLPIGGAAAGLAATAWILFDRRFLAARLHPFLGALIAYYLGVFIYWMTMSIAGSYAGISFAEWRARLQEVVEASPEILMIATWPVGVVTIPLCFLLRKWIISICDPRPAHADTMRT
jgi:hypothetical protein